MSENPKTRANIAPPKRRSSLPENVPAPQAANNMRGDRIAPMTFNMPRDWHTEFKTTAVLHGMNMKELLVECFDAWKREQKRKEKLGS